MEALIINKTDIPWQKSRWKAMAKTAVSSHWVALIKTTAEEKTSLKYMSPVLDPRAAHHLWPKGGCASMKRVAASYRAKMVALLYPAS